MDPNIHPWVAEAWQRSRAAGVRPQSFGAFVRLTETERGERLAAEQTVIRHLDSLYNSIREFLSQNNISLLLLDRESYVLKSYTMSFYQQNPGELEGARLGEKDIGASSISIALAHRTPFILFGPEIWLEECHDSDAATAPIMVDGEIRYLLTMIVMEGKENPPLSMQALMALLLSLKQGLEAALTLEEKRTVKDALEKITSATNEMKDKKKNLDWWSNWIYRILLIITLLYNFLPDFK